MLGSSQASHHLVTATVLCGKYGYYLERTEVGSCKQLPLFTQLGSSELRLIRAYLTAES